MYIGDFSSTAVVSFEWASYNSSGASVTRNVNGTISVFESTSTAAAILGLTDNEDYRGVTGAHNVTIDLTATGFYVPGKTYSAILINSSIDGQTVNAPLAQFSIRNRYMRGTDNAALDANKPANSSLLAISGAGVVTANLGSTTQNFDQVGNVLGSITSVSSNVAGSVGSVVGAVGSVTGNVGGSVTSVSSNVGGNVAGSVGSVAGKVLPTNSSLLAIDATGAVAVALVTGAVGSVGGRNLPANSSLTVISSNGVINANPVLIGGSSTGIDQINANLNATVGSRSILASSDVNFEVVDALNVDSYAEPTGAMPASGSIVTKVGWNYRINRNRLDVSATAKRLYTDGGVADVQKVLTDDGTTYTEAKAST